MFIGAYNADYHSFTIVVAKNGDNFKFFFIDQIVGIENHDKYTLEQEMDLYFEYRSISQDGNTIEIQYKTVAKQTSRARLFLRLHFLVKKWLGL